MKILLSAITLSIIAFLTLSHPAQAQNFTDAQKAELKELFQDYLMNNGEAIMESVSKFQAEQMAEQQKEQNKLAQDFMNEIKKDPSLPMAGNPEGDITIVEFFDYNCGYCRKALEEVEKLLETEKNARVVFIDMPILGPQSQVAAKWSLAANKQGKYFDYHRAIMNHNGLKNAETLEKLAKKAGLDVKQLKADLESDAVKQALSKNLEQARTLGIQGTPGFIIENEVARGFITADQMKTIIADLRNQ